MDQIRHSELLSIEDVGRARIVAAITSDTAVLTQASNMLAFTVQGAVLIVFVAIYVAFLSIAAILTTIVVVSIAAVIFHQKNRRLVSEKQRAAAWERRLFDRLTDFLDGFKEVRLNSARSTDLFNDAVDVSRTAANIKINTQAETFRMIVTSQISMYVLLGAVVFVAPQFSDTLGGAALTKTTTALMFIVGACFGLVQSIPILLNANASADRLVQLENALRATATRPREVPDGEAFRQDRDAQHQFSLRRQVFRGRLQDWPDRFHLAARGAGFHHRRQWVGQIDIPEGSFRPLSPDSGEIILDGRHIDNSTRDEYRALMSAIFFDYHLFRRLYGVSDPEPGEVGRLLGLFRLTEKTGLVDGEFRTLELSGGQRRRLALIVSLLEKRPILLLDEWTAEQDPEFRRKFYDELLPDLMKAGATVVVITHDDRYLDELDLPARRIRMDEGKIVDQRTIKSTTKTRRR